MDKINSALAHEARLLRRAQRPEARHRNDQNPVASPLTNQELQGRSARIPHLVHPSARWISEKSAIRKNRKTNVEVALLDVDRASARKKTKNDQPLTKQVELRTREYS
jgi:hypothetical protein